MSAYRITVTVSAPIAGTEVPDRVARAVENLFPEAELTVGTDRVEGEAHAVETFSERLKEQQILDTARSHLRERIEGETIRFRLKKQAAFVGMVNFSVGNPDELGDIEVAIRIEEPEPEVFVEELAPPTDADGTPIE